MLQRMITTFALTLLICTSVAGTTKAQELPPLRTVERVDLSRYLGRWHEIARLPKVAKQFSEKMSQEPGRLFSQG